MPEIILKVENLNVRLEKEEIIKDLSFEVKKGDVLTILGPNGAGKTVLLKALLGILPHDGKIEWKKEIKIGYVPQRLPFIKDVPISVGEFFKLKAPKENLEAQQTDYEAGKFPAGQGVSGKEIKEILNLVGFADDFSGKRMGELSSGQFQRILIAWALIRNPDVLLFDEPTAGIDIGGEETIYALLAKLKEKRNLTILLVTHDLSVVLKFSNFVICLNKCPVCQGIPQEVLTPKNLHELFGEEVKFYEHHKH